MERYTWFIINKVQKTVEKFETNGEECHAHYINKIAELYPNLSKADIGFVFKLEFGKLSKKYSKYKDGGNSISKHF